MDVNSRTQKSKRNVTIGIASKMVTLLLTFVGRKIFIQNIGIEYLGINGLFANVLSLLSMADLGFGTAMAYSLYEPLATNNNDKVSGLMRFYEKIYNYIAAAVAAVGMALIPFLKYIINMNQDIPNLYFYYILFVSNSVVSYLFVYKATLLNADQKSYIVNSVNAGCNIFKTAVQVLSVYFLKNYTVYLMIMIVSTIMNNLIVSGIVNKSYRYNFVENELPSEEKKAIFYNIKSMFIYKVSSTLISSVDSVLISAILGTTMVGYYTNYQTIILNITAFVNIIFSSLTASIGNLVVQSDAKSKYRVFKVLQMVSFWLSGVIAICVFVLSADFVTLWLGQEYVLSEAVVFAIAMSFFFSNSMQPLWSYRAATGLYTKTKYIMLVAAVENLLLSFVMGRLWGLTGIIMATVIARITTYFWYEPQLLFKEYFEQSTKEYFTEYIIQILIMLLAMGLSKIIIKYIDLEGIVGWTIEAIVCFGIANAFYFVRYSRTNELAILLKKFKIGKS